MPIYEYKCLKCKEKFEVEQRMSDDVLTKHSCGGELQKLISISSFQLKGTGWYRTDYGTDSSK